MVDLLHPTLISDLMQKVDHPKGWWEKVGVVTFDSS